MAKVKLTGLISSITGSMGETTFSPRPGIIQVRKRVHKIHNPNTPLQQNLRKIWSQSIADWKLMPLKKRVLWEQFAKEVNLSKRKIRMMKTKGNRGRMTGANAYCAINQPLILAGFQRIKIPPPSALPPPPTPETSLQQLATFNEKISFKAWLPYPYITPWNNEEIPCVLQAGISVNSAGPLVSIYPFHKLSIQPTQIVIERVKLYNKKVEGKLRMVEANLKDLTHPIIRIRLRTIAQNGKFSLPSPIYTVEVF